MPARSNDIGPYPPSPLFTSITLPSQCAPTVTPPPICTTMNLHSSIGFPICFAILYATAFWFNAWNMDLLGISGMPLTCATGDISSTQTGSTIKAGIDPAFSDILFAISPPKFEACLPYRHSLKSLSIASLIIQAPPIIGRSNPPLPATAESSETLFPWFSSISIELENRKFSSFSADSLQRSISSWLYSADSDQIIFRSSYKAAFIPVLPGLIANIFIFIRNLC